MSKKRPKRKKMKTRALEAAMIEPDENAMMPRARKRKVGEGISPPSSHDRRGEEIERRRR